MYLVAFFAIFTLVSSTIILELHAISNKDRVKETIVGAKIGTGYANDGTNTPFMGSEVALKSHHVDKEVVTKVLLRTCSHLYAKALANNCPSPRNPATVWGFAGNVGGVGNLLIAWTGTTASTFTCGNMDAYGRGLIQKAIPKAFVDPTVIGGRGYRYDFTGMVEVETITGKSERRTDPCGYTEIVDLP